MPSVIEYIDAIARQKKRDVLYVQFHRWEETPRGGRKLVTRGDWRTLPARKQIIEWLDANDIGWSCCGQYAILNFEIAYLGQVYIDIPYDKASSEYRKLEAFLENPDGSARIPGASFCYLPYEVAMENAEHDEPGYWDRWAENF